MDLSGTTRKIQKVPNLYRDTLSSLSSPSEVDNEIDMDLHRTFPDNIYFENNSVENKKKMLRNVLKCFARRCPHIGYCQGLNYIAGILLIITNDEEKSFWLLATIIEDILPNYHDKSMTGVLTDLDVLGELVEQRIPKVGEILKNDVKPWVLISSKWFICLFVDVLPIETLLRVWDCMFMEGSKILMRVALYLYLLKEPELKKKKNVLEIKELFEDLSKDKDVLSCHTFIENMIIKTNPMSQQTLDQLRHKYSSYNS